MADIMTVTEHGSMPIAWSMWSMNSKTRGVSLKSNKFISCTPIVSQNKFVTSIYKWEGNTFQCRLQNVNPYIINYYMDDMTASDSDFAMRAMINKD